MRKAFVYCCLLILAACGSAIAQTNSVEDVKLLAEAGDVIAQYNLGLFYDTGDGVPQDNEEAAKWFRLAANQGDAFAQTSLGFMYENGRGVPQDNEEAVKWFRLAADQGIAAAQNMLGLMYALGRGVPQDDEEAVRWFQLAAEQGFAIAQERLGSMYELGIGVPQDDEEAAKWFRLAAEQGNFIAQTSLGSMYALGRGVPQDDEEALRWYRLAAEQGYANAQNSLGLMYDLGQGVPMDDAEAVRWYRLAAEQGYALAQSNLGVLYDSGQGVPVDDAEAVRWYRLAAEQGLEKAQYNLALKYDLGEGVPEDDAEAARWYRLAAEQGDAGALVTAERLEARAVIASRETDAFPNTDAFPDIDYGTYHALVIGNNEYQHAGLVNLNTAVADAEAIAGVLKEKYGFTVTLLTNATRAQILNELNRFRRELQEDDNLLIYYAGHGELDEGTNTGSWLPVNAERDNDTEWIANSRVTNVLSALRSRNAMVIADSCYSGSIFRGGGSTILTAETQEQMLRRLNEKKTRVALTSGGNEPVVDAVGGSGHSVFAGSFLDVLERNESVLMASDLSRTVRARVIAITANSGVEQTPEFRDLVGHEGGDFLFVPKRSMINQ